MTDRFGDFLFAFMLFCVRQGSPLHFGLKPVSYYPFCTKLSRAIQLNAVANAITREMHDEGMTLEEAMNKWQTMDQLPAEYRS